MYLEITCSNGISDYLAALLLRGSCGVSLGLKYELTSHFIYVEGIEKCKGELLYALIEVGMECGFVRTLSNAENLGDVFAIGWALTNGFVHDPELFEARLCSHLIDCVTDDCFVFVRRLIDKRVKSRAVAEALIQRLHASRTWQVNEGFLLDGIAHVSEQLFLTNWWQDTWEKWRPEIKVAFVCAHSGIATWDETVSSELLKRFHLFCADNQSGIRNAGYREFSRLNYPLFLEMIRLWILCDSEDLKIRAAEAIEYMRVGDGQRNYLELSRDPNRRVRVVSAVSRRKSEERKWSSAFVQNIIEALTSDKRLGSNLPHLFEVLRRHGTREDAERLTAHVSRFSLHPSDDAFIHGITEAIYSRLSQDNLRLDKELLLHWDAISESLTALVTQDTDYVEAEVSLWRRPGSPGDWYGTGRILTPRSLATQFMASFVGDALIEIDGRQAARIVITFARGNDLVFHGSGSYPTPQV